MSAVFLVIKTLLHAVISSADGKLRSENMILTPEAQAPLLRFLSREAERRGMQPVA
jgi:hypothetical protein